MGNAYFQFKQFTIHQDRCAMKVTTDACLFGAWVACELKQSTSATGKISKVLDIGSGTGLLPLMLAQKIDVLIDAVEIEKEAAEQAAKNIQASPWREKIHIFHRDILQINTNKQYDCIISNPPFYEKELSSAIVKKNIAHHSRELRMEELFQTIDRLLQPDGIFFLLLPFKREKELKKKMENQGLIIHKKMIVHQSVLHPPFRLMVMGSLRNQEPVLSSEMFIWDEKQQYTESFLHLLRDYYLYL